MIMRLSKRTGFRIFTYVLQFDAEKVLDTVTREHDGKLLSAASPIVKTLLANMPALQGMRIPDRMFDAGWRWSSNGR